MTSQDDDKMNGQGGTVVDTPLCVRCGDEAESRNNEAGTTSWQFVQNQVTTTTVRIVRVFGTSYRREPHQLLTTDEQSALCVDCWGLFVGRFLQGRSTDGLLERSTNASLIAVRE